MAVVPPSQDLTALAKNAAATKYNAQLAALERQKTLTDLADQANVDSINQFQPLGTEAIKSAYQNLIGNLVANRGAQGQEFANSLSSMQGGYNQAQEVAKANKQDSLNWLTRLGLNTGAGSNEDQGYLGQLIYSQQNPLEDRFAGYAANALANANQWGTEHMAHYQTGINQQEAAGAAAQSGFQKQIADLLNQAGLARSEHQYNILGQMQDIEGEKGSFTIDQLAQLVQQEFENNRAYAQDSLAEQELAARIAMNNASLADSAADRSLRAQAMEQDSSRQASNDAWEREKFLLSLGIDTGRLSLDQRKQAFDEMQASQPGNYSYSGEGGLAQWAQDTGASPDIIAAARNYLNQGYDNSLGVPGADPYAEALDALSTSSPSVGRVWSSSLSAHKPVNTTPIRQAISILAGQYGGRRS